MTRNVDCIWNGAAELGEGPVWRAETQALWFTDIKGRRLHCLSVAAGAHRAYAAPEQIGFALPCADGGWIAGLKSGLHRFEPATGAFALIAAIEADRPGNRLNDGYVDAEGRLWFGTMDDGEAISAGAIYRFDAAGASRQVEGVAITNGPCMSPDGRTFYYTDTRNRLVLASAVDGRGDLSATRTLIEIEPGAGYPDGTTVDSEGCLWVALYAGWAVRRYAPDGRLLEVVHMPCANVTKIAFGGADNATAFATTAWKGLSPEARAEQPLAGGVFAFRAPAPGLAQHACTVTA